MGDEYRDLLVTASLKAQDDYDKAIVTLSGSALGISLVFIKEVIGPSAPISVTWVVCAWGFWTASLAAVVASYFFSIRALNKAIDQVDNPTTTVTTTTATATTAMPVASTSAVAPATTVTTTAAVSTSETTPPDPSAVPAGRVGGWASLVTGALNVLSGTLFIAGIICFIVFAKNNIEGKVSGDHNGRQDSQKSAVSQSEPENNSQPTPAKTHIEEKAMSDKKQDVQKGFVPPQPPKIQPPTPPKPLTGVVPPPPKK